MTADQDYFCMISNLDMDTLLLTENDQFQISTNFHDENITIHFALDGESKGAQLEFNSR